MKAVFHDEIECTVRIPTLGRLFDPDAQRVAGLQGNGDLLFEFAAQEHESKGKALSGVSPGSGERDAEGSVRTLNGRECGKGLGEPGVHLRGQSVRLHREALNVDPSIDDFCGRRAKGMNDLARFSAPDEVCGIDDNATFRDVRTRHALAGVADCTGRLAALR
jgi:hypothetical protein